MTDMDMVMAAVLVISLLVLLTLSLWEDWHMRTREFREMERRLLEMQGSRRGGEEE